jgi:NAD(P)-dependent dehydrogenase (short-subunit alcohol dehydrogenase family)
MQGKRLEGKVALITGAASGIGLACARRYAREGATVVGCDIQETSHWSEVAELAPAARFFSLDVCDRQATESAVGAIEADHGRLDVLVTAAGVAGGGPVHLLAIEEWDRVLNVNLKGTYLSIRAALPLMMARRAGSIITIASIEGLEASEGGSAYNASKGGVVLLTKNVAMDYGRLGIRANAICPGFIDTPLLQSVLGDESLRPYRARLEDQHKVGRFGRPEEIAGAAFFLASDDSSFVTGQAIVVDGGFTAGHRVGLTELMGLE